MQHEVLGVFGLVGAGRTQTAEAIFGLRKLDSGKIQIDGKTEKIRNPYDAVQKRIGFVPEDRKTAGLFLKLAVGDNINMAGWKIVSRFGIINFKDGKGSSQKNDFRSRHTYKYRRTTDKYPFWWKSTKGNHCEMVAVKSKNSYS